MELKPCPFCGKEAKMLEQHSFGKAFIVCCSNPLCLVHPVTPITHTQELAEEFWNERAET